MSTRLVFHISAPQELAPLLQCLHLPRKNLSFKQKHLNNICLRYVLEDDFDVAVVGAGPAGSSCAIRLSEGGKNRIALIDGERFPRDKSCGDGIEPGAVQMLKALGVSDFLKDHRQIKYLSVSAPDGLRVRGILPPVGGQVPIGYVIPRTTYDNAIFASAIRSGAGDY